MDLKLIVVTAGRDLRENTLAMWQKRWDGDVWILRVILRRRRPLSLRFMSLCADCQSIYMSKKYPVLLTQSSKSCWSNQLHQLVVAHISQQVLQASLSSECRELVAAAASAAWRSGDGRVVQVLIHLTAVLIILVSLWLLMEIWQARIPWNQS